MRRERISPSLPHSFPHPLLLSFVCCGFRELVSRTKLNRMLMRSLLRCISAPWYGDCLQCHEGDSCVSHVMRQFCQEVLWQQYQECPPYLLHTDSFSFCKLQNSASCLCIHFRHLLTSLKHVFIVLLPLKWFAGLISFNFNCLCANDYQEKNNKSFC